MITIADYWMGRDQTHGLYLGTDIRANAARTVVVVNTLLELAQASGVRLEMSPRTGTRVASGWRPPDINAATPNAAPRSKHLTGHAVDIYDPDGDLDEWAMLNADGALAKAGLWLEHPSATKGWCHLQTLPPGSGRRVFFP